MAKIRIRLTSAQLEAIDFLTTSGRSDRREAVWAPHRTEQVTARVLCLLGLIERPPNAIRPTRHYRLTPLGQRVGAHWVALCDAAYRLGHTVYPTRSTTIVLDDEAA